MAHMDVVFSKMNAKQPYRFIYRLFFNAMKKTDDSTETLGKIETGHL